MLAKITLSLILALAILTFRQNPGEHPSQPGVLIFSKTNGYRHKSIEAGIAAIKKLGEANGFTVDATEDSTLFTKKKLKQYRAIVFVCPTGKVFGQEQEKALQEYVHKGGGIVGIHSATDCEYNWPWFGQMMGAYFKSHPKQQQATLTVTDAGHPSTNMLPTSWERFDEWYNFKDINPDIKPLLKINEASYKGGENGADHPMAWYHGFEGGRVFYTALGHTEESYQEPLFLQHVLGGINYAMGK